MQQFQQLFGGSPMSAGRTSTSGDNQSAMEQQKLYLMQKGLWQDGMVWNGAEFVMPGQTPTTPTKPGGKTPTATATGDAATRALKKWQKDVARVEDLGGGGLSVDMKNNLGLLSPTPGFAKSTGYHRSRFTNAMNGSLGQMPPAQPQSAAPANEMDQLAALLGGMK